MALMREWSAGAAAPKASTALAASIRLGRIAGIPIRIHYSWLFIFAWFSYSLANNFFPARYDAPTGQYWAIAVVASVLFFACVLAHELGHSVAARRYGIPVTSITLFFLGGIAQIGRDAPRPMAEGVIAIAGPAVSIALGGIFFGVGWALRDASAPASSLFYYLGYANGLVGLFNLIPGYPMDGGRIFRAVVWGIRGDVVKATRAAANLGRGVGVIFMGGGVAMGFFLESIFGGMMLIFLGLFLIGSARQSVEQVTARAGLRGLRVRDVMTIVPTIPPRLDLRSLVENYISLSGHAFFLVGERGAATGSLSLSDISRVPRERWAATTVGDITTPLGNLPWVDAAESAESALDLLQEKDTPRLLVADGGDLVGSLTLEHVAAAMRRGGA